MKRIIAIAVLLIATAGFADDSPLVKAAKASGGPKKKTTKKVITNADLDKAPNKPAATKPATPPPPPATPPISIADQDKLRHDRIAAQNRADAAQAKVTDLDKELDRLEQAYYAENDPNYRDKAIAERFEQTKKQLESARKDLAEARDGLEKMKRN
jgi:molecular chaperone GrpE (heat shock protein)